MLGRQYRVIPPVEDIMVSPWQVCCMFIKSNQQHAHAGKTHSTDRTCHAQKQQQQPSDDPEIAQMHPVIKTQHEVGALQLVE